MKDIRITAHRGAGGPENSLASFRKALEMEVHAIETDIRTTLDGHAVLMHDETVDRTTDGRGRVSDMCLEEIRGLKLRNGEPVPTLTEALETIDGRCQAILELKDVGAAAAAGTAVRDLKHWKNVTFSSSHGPWLVDLKLKYPPSRTAFISKERKLDSVRIAKSLKAGAIHASGRIATGKLILRAHIEGLDVYVWTVNGNRMMRKFIAMGADGIITDRPDILIKVLADIRERELRSPC